MLSTRILKPWLRALVVISVLGVWAGQLEAQTTIKVGQIPIASSLPFFAAQEQRLFEAEGLKLEVEQIAGGARLLPAIAGGSLHMGLSNYVSLLLARQEGFDFVVVAPQNKNKLVRTPQGDVIDASPVLALEESGIKTARDLKGKIFAVNTFRNINDLYAYEWLELKGLNPKKDVNFIEMPFPRMGPVLRSRQVDAVMSTEPFNMVEQEKGGIRVLGYPYAEASKTPLSIAGYVASRSWVEANRDTVNRFVRAFYRGIDYINQHPESWPLLLSKYIKLKVEVATKMHLWDWHYPIDVAALQDVADLATKWGLLKDKVDARQIVYTTALKYPGQ